MQEELIIKINKIKMNKVLKSLRSKLTIDEILIAYNNYHPPFKTTTINNCTLQQIYEFSKIFKFQGNTLEKVKKELNHWLKNYQMFYDENAENIYNNMQNCLIEFNSQSHVQYPFINYIPQYGGLINENDYYYGQIEFMNKNHLVYALTGEIPSNILKSEKDDNIDDQYLYEPGPID